MDKIGSHKAAADLFAKGLSDNGKQGDMLCPKGCVRGQKVITPPALVGTAQARSAPLKEAWCRFQREETAGCESVLPFGG